MTRTAPPSAAALASHSSVAGRRRDRALRGGVRARPRHARFGVRRHRWRSAAEEAVQATTLDGMRGTCTFPRGRLVSPRAAATVSCLHPVSNRRPPTSRRRRPPTRSRRRAPPSSSRRTVRRPRPRLPCAAHSFVVDTRSSRPRTRTPRRCTPWSSARKDVMLEENARAYQPAAAAARAAARDAPAAARGRVAGTEHARQPAARRLHAGRAHSHRLAVGAEPAAARAATPAATRRAGAAARAARAARARARAFVLRPASDDSSRHRRAKSCIGRKQVAGGAAAPQVGPRADGRLERLRAVAPRLQARQAQQVAPLQLWFAAASCQVANTVRARALQGGDTLSAGRSVRAPQHAWRQYRTAPESASGFYWASPAQTPPAGPIPGSEPPPAGPRPSAGRTHSGPKFYSKSAGQGGRGPQPWTGPGLYPHTLCADWLAHDWLTM